MNKSRVSVRAKVYNLGLFLKDAAAGDFSNAAAASAAASSPAAMPFENSTPALVAARLPDSVKAAAANLNLKLPERLSTIEEMLKVLDAAVAALRQPGLSSVEISRLRQIIYGVKIYNDLFPKFLDYVSLENELVELRRQLASENKRRSGEEDSKA